jgi:hypothetical protein
MIGATLLPAQASAEAKVYPYASHANYCPAGLQPVTIAGVICCGTPNQHMSYQQVMAHPVRKTHKVRYHKPRTATYSCEVGEKGCTYSR